MLRDEFEREGNWLFRWRSYVPLLLAVVLFSALSGFHYPFGSHYLDTVWDLICYTLSLFGLAIRVMTVGFVPRDTSGRNTSGQVAVRLNTSGMYSLMRHPLYFGNFWMWFGASLFPRVWWSPVLVSVFFLVVYERIMFAEERFLSEKFGDQYLEWSSRTSAFWPRLKTWRPPEYPFSLRAVLRRENSSLLAVTTVFFVLEVVSTVVVERHFELDPVWTAIFGIALGVYAALKVLKKLKLLNEPGR